MDTVDVGRGIDEGRFAALPVAEVDTSSFFPEIVMAANNTRDGVTAVTADAHFENEVGVH